MAETDKTTDSVTLHADPGGPVTTETLTLDPAEYPYLTGLLTGPEAATAQLELTRLIGQYWQARSIRREVQVLAKLVVSADEGAGEELAAYVQDISKAGIRLAVLRTVHIGLTQLMNTRILLQVNEGEGERILDLPATFVRLAGHDDKYLYLAFSFEGLDTTLAHRIDQLSDLFFSA